MQRRRDSYQIDVNVQQTSKNNPAGNNQQARPGMLQRILTLCLAELLGTSFLMFFGCMSLVSGFSQAPVSDMQPALVFGFVVSTIIVVFGHISGAHLNPSVTVAALVLRDISVLEAVVYVLAQCAGCILGYALLGVATPHEIFSYGVPAGSGQCVTMPHPSLSHPQALLVEFLGTALLVFTCCGVWDHRNAHQGDSNPVKFALVITLLSITVGPYTGASLNPARSLAPAVVNNVWTNLWIYWVAPPLAGLVTPLIYKYAFERKRLEKQPDDTPSTISPVMTKH
uniref:Aquaporin 4-like protein n=1 Tax=Bactericera cockerelli TaxID=290155 RepID=V5V1X9_9HEMI|nr:aquaporin 4-like protein [Bactericera cockerelli]